MASDALHFIYKLVQYTSKYTPHKIAADLQWPADLWHSQFEDERSNAVQQRQSTLPAEMLSLKVK